MYSVKIFTLLDCGKGSREVFYSGSIHKLFNDVSIYIMPMVNPDGVDLVTGNLPRSSSAFIRAQSISKNFSNISFPSRLESKYTSELI